MREGFEQSTDDAFSKYLFISKGSLAEVLSRLESSQRKGFITSQELVTHTAAGEILGKMLGGFIKYLAKSGFKDRGRYKAKNQEPSGAANTTKDEDYDAG